MGQKAVGALAAGAAAAICGALCLEPRKLDVCSFQEEAPGISRRVRVVFFTDTHFGKFYPDRRAGRLVETINGRAADIVLFGGDLIDNLNRDRGRLDLAALSGALGRIQAPGGKFAVWGNHDYGGGAASVYEGLLTSCGFQILRNRSVFLQEYGVRIAGYDDLLCGRRDPERYRLPEGSFTIAVAHEPAAAQKVSCPGGCFFLAGHTHGGQVGIPVLAQTVLPPGSGPFLKGLYSQDAVATGQPLRLYVSSGVGMTHLPLRLFNPPQVVEAEFLPARV